MRQKMDIEIKPRFGLWKKEITGYIWGIFLSGTITALLIILIMIIRNFDGTIDLAYVLFACGTFSGFLYSIALVIKIHHDEKNKLKEKSWKYKLKDYEEETNEM